MSGSPRLPRRLIAVALRSPAFAAFLFLCAPAHAADIRVAGPKPAAGYGHSITALSDGRILSYGGTLQTQVWSPERRNWELPRAPTLRDRRLFHTATLTSGGRVVLAGGVDSVGQTFQAATLATTVTWHPDSDRWESGATLLFARFGHTATALRGGDVLIVGGASAIRDDKPAAPFLRNVERLSANSSREMRPAAVARSNHTATLLSDGRVLVVGGLGEDGAPIAAVEIYDPAQDRWTPAAPLRTSRADHTATLLSDGKVLVAGGRSQPLTRTATAEIWNPGSGEWTDAPPLAQSRSGHSATLLNNGAVLVAGGRELENQGALAVERLPINGEHWELSGSLPTQLPYPHSVLLPNGNVLLFGLTPSSPDAGPFVWLPMSESRTRFSPRWSYSTALLADGRVLVAGGETMRGHSATVQIYDPKSEDWQDAAPMHFGRRGHTMQRLPDGRVLVSGGWITDPQTGKSSGERSASGQREDVPSEIWDPRTGQWELSVFVPANMFWNHLGLLRDSRSVGVVLDDRSGERILAYVFFWSPADASVGQSLRVERPRQGGAATVLPTGHILFVGGSGRDANRTDLWDPNTRQWTQVAPFAGLLLNGRLLSLHDGRVVAISPGGVEQQETLALWNGETGYWSRLPLPVDIDSRRIQLAEGLSSGRILLVLDDASFVWEPKAGRWDRILHEIDWENSPNIVSREDGRVFAFRKSARNMGEESSVSELDIERKVWRPRLDRYFPRRYPAVVPFANGTALVAGGDVAIAQIWRLSDDTWHLTGYLHQPLLYARGAALADGRVVVMGFPPHEDRLVCELWSPKDGQFTPCGSLPSPRGGPGALLLEPLDGRRVMAMYSRGRTAAIWSEEGGWETITVRAPNQLQTPYTDGASVSYLDPIATAWDPAAKSWIDVTQSWLNASRVYLAMKLADGSVFALPTSNGTYIGYRWIPRTQQLEQIPLREPSREGMDTLAPIGNRCAAAWSAFVWSPGSLARGSSPPSTMKLLDTEQKLWRTAPVATVEVANAGVAVTSDNMVLLAGMSRLDPGIGRGTQRFRVTCEHAAPLDASDTLFLPTTFEIERKPPSSDASKSPNAPAAKRGWLERTSTWMRHQRIKLNEWRSGGISFVILLGVLLFLPAIFLFRYRQRT